jgi:Ca2+-binding RTX toxin-like protein
MTFPGRYVMANIKVKLIGCTTLSMALGLAAISVQADVINCTGGTCDGTPRSDTITGTAVRDVIHGRAGDDSIGGLAGNDSCGGGSGEDTIDCGRGADYLQGGRNKDTLDGSLDDRTDTLKGGNGGADTFLFDTVRSGADRILDFNEGGDTPGDVVRLTNVTTEQLQAIYGESIEAGDLGVTNVNGDLVIDFIPVSGPAGSDMLTFTGLAGQSLAVGTDVVGSP